MSRSFGSLARGLANNLRKGNVGVIGSYLRQGAPPRLSRNVSLVFYVLHSARLPAPEISGAVVRIASRSDLPKLRFIHPEHHYDRLFEQGSTCFLLELDGTPCAQRWVNIYDWHVSTRDAYRLKIGPGGAWLTGAYTHPDYRGKGLYTYLEYKAKELLENEGVHRLYGAVLPDNIGSIKPKERMGFEPIYRYRVIRAAGATWHEAESLSGPVRRSRGFGWWIEDNPFHRRPMDSKAIADFPRIEPRSSPG